MASLAKATPSASDQVKQSIVGVMADDFMAEETFAAEFAEDAEQAQRTGDAATAEIMWDLSRRHRVKGLELDGRLAAMQVRYAMMFEP